MEAWVATRNALQNVLEASEGERILVICDEERRILDRLLLKVGCLLGCGQG